MMCYIMKASSIKYLTRHFNFCSSALTPKDGSYVLADEAFAER